MKVTIELDDSQPASGNAAIALIGRIFGFTAATAPLASSTSTASPPPPASAPTPAAAGAPPAAVPMTAPPPAAPASAPPMASPPAPAQAAPTPVTVTVTAPPAPASGGITLAQFATQVQAFATAYGAKATKARFGELAAAFQQPGWTSNSAIPADRYAEVLPWFQVATA